MNDISAERTAPKSNGQAEELAGRALEPKQAGVRSGALEALEVAVDEVAGADFDALREDLAKLTQTLGQLVHNQAASTRAQVMDAVGTAGDNISDTASVVQDKLVTIEASLEAQIQNNPWSAIAIALGLGLLIGKLS